MSDDFVSPDAAARPGLDIKRLLNPCGVAIVGASRDLNRIGGQPLQILRESGYRGRICPVNPKYEEIEGIRCYPDVSQVPRPCDVALVAVSATQVPEVIRQCGGAGIPFAVVLSAGFSETGDAGKALQMQLVSAAQSSGVRVVGPNCLGLLNLKDSVRNGFGPTIRLRTMRPGPLAMVSQSGGVGFGLVAIAADVGIGFNYAVSTGNEADVTALDFLAYFLECEDISVVTCFLEGVQDGRRLIEIGKRALELGKPILVWKAGNTDAGREAAISHTARMTAGYEFFRTTFQQGGFVEIGDVDDIIDCAKVFLPRKLPAGNRVGVVSVSGGAGVLFADQCTQNGLALPPFSAATAAELRKNLAPYISIANPLDATANTNIDGLASYQEVIRQVLADANIDQVIARAPRGRGVAAWGKQFIDNTQKTHKPVIVNWPSSVTDHGELLRLLEEHGVPCFVAPGRAVRALAKLTEFAAKKRKAADRSSQPLCRKIARQALDVPHGARTLGEYRSKRILAVYGVPVVSETLLREEEAEALNDAPLSFPLAVKAASPDLPHKTEAGAVRLDVRDVAGLKQASRDVLTAARRYRPDARIDGVLVQAMAHGLEVIIGAINDPRFGPVVTFGLGGIFAELLHDVSRRFAPFDTETAREMIAEIKGAPLLTGYRNSAPLDVDALADALTRVSLLVADHADHIAEIDINPLFVREAGKGVVAADALIVLKHDGN